MSLCRVTPLNRCLSGSVEIPASKSHSLRAILFGAMGRGKSIIKRTLPSPDLQAMIVVCRAFGAHIEVRGEMVIVDGCGGHPRVPEDVINVGNSGQVLRFGGALAGLCEGYSLFSGDHSIRFSRPLQPLLDGLNQLGAHAISTKGDGRAPMIVKGRIRPGRARVQGEDSQPISGLLIASAFLEDVTELEVDNPGETPWLELTLSWLKRLGAHIEHKDYRHYIVKGCLSYNGFEMTVPGDFSSAAFPLTAAVLTDSEITLHNLDVNDVQGDKILISILQEMGAKITVDALQKIVKVHKGSRLRGQTIDVNACIDALPILAVIGTMAEGETHLINGRIARFKECDRIAAISTELRKMGAKVIETEDGLIIYQSLLKGAPLLTYKDHRLVMALAIAGLIAEGESVLHEADSVKKSYPEFFAQLNNLGAKFIYEERSCL